MHRFIRRIGHASARRPWITIGTWAVAAAIVIGLAGTAGGAFVDDFVAPGSQSERAMELLDERFPEAAGGSAMAVFAVDHGGTLDSRREVIEAALARVAKVEHVATVADPFEAGTVSPDGRIGFAELTFDLPASDLGPAPFEALAGAIAPARAAGVTAELGGDAVFVNAEAETSGTEAVGLLAALVVLVVAFGTVVAALVPIGLALVAVAVGVGGITLLANAMDVSTSAPTVAAMIGLGVGVDYALFIGARYRENRSRGQDNAAALAGAMGSSGAAVVFAGGTVVVAMAALALTGLGVLTSIGLATSLVVLIAVAAATTLLPALLSLLGDRIDTGRLLRRRRTPVRAQDSAWWRFAHRVSGRPWPYLLAATAVLLALAAPALGMQTRLSARRRRADDHHPPPRLRPVGRGLRSGRQRPAADRRRPADAGAGHRDPTRADRAARGGPGHRRGRRAADRPDGRRRGAAGRPGHRARGPGHLPDDRTGPRARAQRRVRVGLHGDGG